MARKKIKPLRKKKKLTEKQRAAQKLRLEKMRAKRKPAEYKNVHKSVLALDNEDSYSFKNVREWIKHNKEQISMLQSQARNRELSPKDKQHAIVAADNKKAYIRFIEHYLRSGDWIGVFSGKDETNKVIPKCVAMAYYPDGTPKRTVGVFYPDIGGVWSRDMDESQYITQGNREYEPAKNISKPGLIAKTDKQFTKNL